MKKKRNIEDIPTYRPLIFNHTGQLDMRDKYRNDPCTLNYKIAHPDIKGEAEIGLGNELFGLARPTMVDSTEEIVAKADNGAGGHKSMSQLCKEKAERELQRQEKLLLGESTEMTQAEIDKMIEDTSGGSIFT